MVGSGLLEEWSSMTTEMMIRGEARRQFGENERVFFFIVPCVHTMAMIVGLGVSQKSDRPTN